MNNLKSKQWHPGEWIYINKLTWDQMEIDQIIDVLKTDWFAGNSQFNLELENKLKEHAGLNYFQTANSGSAAIELAVQALIQSGRWKRGDRILHPALTFPTSISSAIMAGLIPVFVDVKLGTFVIDEDKVIDALSYDENIKGAIIPALLGNSPHVDKIKQVLGDRPLVLDSCDVMGTTWGGRELASYATLSTYSFYGSHHISTFGVGGAVGTNDPELYKLIKSMTFWGRKESDNPTQLINFLKRYTYETLGLDAQLSAVQAAFGLAQIERLPYYIGARRAIFVKLQRLFSSKLRYFILPERTSDKADISWFCYPVVVRENAPFTRDDFVNYLLENKVEIRPIFCNILDQDMFGPNFPARPTYYTVGDIPNTVTATNRGFFIPACPMDEKQEEHYLKILSDFLERY